MRWTAYAVAVMVFNILGLLAVYALQRLPGLAAAEPAGPRRRVAGFGVQHRGQLRHQHQLAGLRRRDDDELPHPDARPDGAELRVGRDRHGGAGRAHPRLQRALGRHDRQLLGRPDAQRRSTSCCRCRSSCAVVLVSQGVVQTFSAYQTVDSCTGRLRQPEARRSRSAGTGRRAIRSPNPPPPRSRPSRSVRPRRRSRSSSSARTAAASSTSTRRTRSRTRRRSRTSSRCSRSC